MTIHVTYQLELHLFIHWTFLTLLLFPSLSVLANLWPFSLSLFLSVRLCTVFVNASVDEVVGSHLFSLSHSVSLVLS